jgi:ribosomal protein S1
MINKAINTETIVSNMVLQGEVESKEAKGFLVNFGLKDKSKGFISFSDSNSHLAVG